MRRLLMQRIILAALMAIALGFAASAEAAEGVKKPDPMQFARGAKAWAENCNRCHNVREPKELSDWEWEVTMSHMAKLGNIPQNVARDIEAFLKGSN